MSRCYQRYKFEEIAPLVRKRILDKSGKRVINLGDYVNSAWSQLQVGSFICWLDGHLLQLVGNVFVGPPVHGESVL